MFRDRQITPLNQVVKVDFGCRVGTPTTPNVLWTKPKQASANVRTPIIRAKTVGENSAAARQREFGLASKPRDGVEPISLLSWVPYAVGFAVVVGIALGFWS